MFTLSFSRFIALFLALIIGGGCFVGSGCRRHTDEDNQDVSVKGEEPKYLIVVAIDLSGSFAEQMANEGKAFEFLRHMIEYYFTNSIGTNNRIVIAQLSATNRALLWDGTPMQLRRDFPSADHFRDFLLEDSHPAGSRLHAGIVDSINYVLSDQSVINGKTHTAVFVLSDLIDNLSGPNGEQQLAQSLTAFSKTRGSVGFYYLDPALVSTWRQILRDSGIKNWACESSIVSYPPLPSIE